MRPLLLAAAVSLAGCASGGTTAAPVVGNTPTRVMAPVTAGSVDMVVNPNLGAARAALPAPAARTYAALRVAYADLGIPVAEADSARLVLGNPRFQVSRRLGTQSLSAFFDCGRSATGAPAADSYRLRIGVSSTVVAAGTGSELLTTVAASAQDRGGSSRDPVVCHSTGRLEEQLAMLVRLRLQS